MIVQLRKSMDGVNGQFTIDVDLEIREGSLVTIYGDSGTGKTSLLRMLAGFLSPQRGQIVFGDAIWYSSSNKINIKPQARDVGFVFQDYALFPNMTVKQNLEFALPKGEDKKLIYDLIDIIELKELQDRKPETLSGGQKQRVAIARALARKPKLLLLDEPFAALDKNIRSSLQDYILSIHRTRALTTVLVSHYVGDIFKMSDEVVLLKDGKIVRRSAPDSFYTSQEISGKFKFTGEIAAIERADIVFIVSIVIGNNLVKIVADESEVTELNLGDEVLVASKAFNPVIQKIK